jgi:CRP-like cAMP-binding protein
MLLPEEREERMAPKHHPSALGNRLLDALTFEDFDRLRPHLEPVSLSPREPLIESGERMEHVYFIEQGVVSLVQIFQEGARIEVAMIGNEGFVGTPIVLGADRMPCEAMVHMAGSAWRMPALPLREATERSASLRALLLRYVQALTVQVAQTAACNGRHTLNHRLARWLLMARDRAQSDDLPLSHEFIASMLGMRRAGVTVGTAALAREGAIAKRHGSIIIRDRAALESAACACYRVIREEYARLLAHTQDGTRIRSFAPEEIAPAMSRGGQPDNR